MSEQADPGNGALRASEARFRALFDHAPIGLAQLDRQGRILAVNRTLQDILGYDEPEFRRVTFLEITHPEDQAADWALFEEVRAGRRDEYTLDKRYLRKDGGIVWGRLTVTVTRDAQGMLESIIGMMLDVTEHHATEEQLRRIEGRYRSLMETSPDAILLHDLHGIIQMANQHTAVLYHYASPRELIGQNAVELVVPADRERAAATLGAVAGGAATGTHFYTGQRHDGTTFFLELHATRVYADAAGTMDSIMIVARDITARKEADERLLAERDLLQTVMDAVPDAIYVEDAQLRFLRVNMAHARLLGAATTEELLGKTDFDYFPPELARQFGAQEHQILATGQPIINDLEDQSSLGHGERWILASKVPLRQGGEIIGLVGISRDITELKRAEESLRHLALHDSLTNLPNRTLLHARVSEAFNAGAGGPRPLALLLLDLDHFKEINDAFGHHRGDALLREATGRLLGVVGAGDTVARLGGDEFAVLLPGADTEEATRVAEAIRAVLDAPFFVDGQLLRVAASVGIALAPAHGSDGATLLRRADMAMYAAKRGRLGQAIYEPAQDQHSPERLARIAELHEAIEAGALALHYQPQVEPASGHVCGVEALVRWPHPVYGLIAPDQFVPLAEQTGLIAPLTDWVLGEAIRQCKEWQVSGLPLGVSVNLSMWNLHDPTLPARIADLLQRHGLSPALLRLELTESALMADTARTIEVLARLSALGLRLAVDDFGAGYSSLAYLKKLPVDELKIDRGFVREMATDATDAAIVASTVVLGHALGLRVVAEGIEDQATWDMLVGMGCDVAQGYHISRPLPPEALARWLRKAPWAVA